jgi:hypothetical protein
MFLGSPKLVQRAWRTKYVCSTALSWSTIMMTAKKFEKLVQSLIYKPEKEILVKNVKMPKLSSKKSCQKNLHYRSEKFFIWSQTI